MSLCIGLPLLLEALPVAIKEVPKSEASLFKLTESQWVAIGAIVSALVALATGALAGFTWWLAAKTSDLADETLSGIRQADEHHQQSFMPYVELDSVTITKEAWATNAWRISGDIGNAGTGPATNVLLVLARFGSQSFTDVTLRIAALAPGEWRELNEILRFNHDTLDVPFRIVVRWENVFESIGTTVVDTFGETLSVQISTPPLKNLR